jgi:hypothetical protein
MMYIEEIARVMEMRKPGEDKEYQGTSRNGLWELVESP